MIANLENNQIDTINHIETNNTEFVITTQPAKIGVESPNILVYI